MESRHIYKLHKCSVLGCNDTKSGRHLIPVNNPSVRDIWLQRINNPALTMLSDEDLHQRRICAAHFLNVCKGKTRLLSGALPTLGLPGFNEEATPQNSFYENLSKEYPCASTSSGNQQEMCVAEPLMQEVSEMPRRRNKKFPHINVYNPQTRQLCIQLKKYKAQCHTLKGKVTSYEKRIRLAEKLVREPVFRTFEKAVSPVVRDFLLSQLRESKKAARGRRFSFNDKVLALSLYKCSPKGYRLLQRIFSLPSYRTLSRVLARIPFVAGITQRIFQHLKTVAEHLKPAEKYCNIIFDEVALQAGIHLNRTRDCIEGFENYGIEKSFKFADHALVFMLQGVHKKWKQPVAFMFCEGTTSAQQLAVLIKRVTMEVIGCGLVPVATICDQGSTNQAAINILLQETKQVHEKNVFGFIVENQEVVPLYDYPHLVKGIRNNLLTKDLIFTENGIRQRASWHHIQELYEWDRPTRYFNIFTKLTDAHIVPSKIKKMKVKNCTQVFSRSVGNFMQCLIDAGSSVLTKEAEGTARAFLFFDKLFDSFNGSSSRAQEGHELRCAVTNTSPHHHFWIEAKAVLRTMKYECPRTKRCSVPPSLKNWVWTISGMEYIWKRYQDLGFKQLIPRNFNQDGLENFFGCIRSHGARNINPTCSSFISSFKALTLNNFIAPTSVSFNCENDLSAGVLDNLKAFILSNGGQETESVANVSLEIQFNDDEDVNICVSSYMARVVLQKLLGYVGQCSLCSKNLVTTSIEAEHLLILKVSARNKLLLPSKVLSVLFKKTTYVILKYLCKLCISNNITNHLHAAVTANVNFDKIKCKDHEDLVNNFIKICIDLTICTWIKRINGILSGQDTRLTASKCKDSLQLAAFNKYIKSKTKKRN